MPLIPVIHLITQHESTPSRDRRPPLTQVETSEPLTQDLHSLPTPFRNLRPNSSPHWKFASPLHLSPRPAALPVTFQFHYLNALEILACPCISRHALKSQYVELEQGSRDLLPTAERSATLFPKRQKAWTPRYQTTLPRFPTRSNKRDISFPCVVPAATVVRAKTQPWARPPA